MSYLSSATTIARIALFAAVLLAVLYLATQSFFPAFAQENQMDETIPYNENDTVPVATYTAMDPEGEAVTWSVTDSNGGTVDFEITSGMLTFINPPDYESPTGGSTDNSETYTVTITVTDADDVQQLHTWDVTVNLQNVNELGEVTFSHPQPKEGTAISVTLTDDDLAIDGDGVLVTPNTTDLTNSPSTTWQWYRSETGSDPWTEIEEMATSSSYTPVEADVGHYLRATAMYYDAQDDEQRTAHSKVSDTNKVLMEEYINKAPVFPDHSDATAGSQITISVPEDESLGEGDPVGQPLQASDLGEDGTEQVLTYTITAGANSALFDIDSATGQLELANAADPILDFERTSNTGDYVVVVTATDPDNLTGEATVTIRVTDVDENPTITAGDITVTYPEIDVGSPNTADVEDAYIASDEDAGDPDSSLTWKLSGNDASNFSITPETGGSIALSFRSPPDFEAPVDRNRDNVYNVTVEVADPDNPREKDTRDVTVRISNEQEPGSISRTSHPQPEVGQPIRVTLNDPDKVRNNRVTWEWTLGATTTTQNNGGLTASFTPRANETVSVTATYTDGTGTLIENLAGPTLASVQVRPNPDRDPAFPSSESGTRSIAENTSGIVGDAVGANDDDDDTLLYTLSGTHASLFTINSTNGQLSVASDNGLDFEARSTYTVDVTATDPSGSSDRATKRVTITVTNAEEDPRFTEGPDDNATVYHDENSTAVVATYKAKDDEDYNAQPRLPLTWTVSDDRFSIEGGVLRFKEAPNYEALPGVEPTDGISVTITVADQSTTVGTNPTRAVTVMVNNLDEDGEITGLPAQPKEGVAITVTLTDPDGGATGDGGTDGSTETLTDNASTTWQWFRSRSRTSGWALISATSTANEDVNTDTYTPEAADEGYYLRATAMYRDGQGVNKVTKPGVGVTARTVQAKEYVNSAPIFPDDDDDTNGYQITMEVNEDNSLEAGDPVGGPVTATDIGSAGTQELLVYTVDPADIADDDESLDQALFTIDRSTGQLKLAGTDTTLDFENPDDSNEDNEYVVTVKATDPSSTSSIAVVTIEVQPVEEAPEFGMESEADAATPANLAATTTAENNATTTVLSTYNATDDEDGTTNVLTWSLSGVDKDKFSLCDDASAACPDPTGNTVSLRFKQMPNFEMPADSGRNNVYNVTVVATASDEKMAEKPVTVTVTNVDEPGTVTLSHPQPEVGTRITANLTDPDDGVSGITWEWLWCEGNDPGCAATTTINTTSRHYEPIAGDAGRFLKAIATYTDRTSDGNQDKRTASTISIFAVQADETGNQPPVLPDVTQTLKKDENSEGTTLVVGTVAASDPDDGNLLYRLGGTDAALFTIASIDADTQNPATTTAGQISLKNSTKLDYETKKTYSITVTAIDPSLASDSVSVTIEVTDVDEPPFVTKRGLHVTGEANVSYEENDTVDVGIYRVTGPDASGATLSLSGPDESAFSLSGGVLSFKSPPDFEAATDVGTDNVYNVTVMASMGDFDASQDVTVNVTNVDEDGTVELTYDQNQVRVGVAITAEEPVDPDGGVTSVEWQWESSSDGSTGWSDIAGATSAAYTPVDGDVGNFLRATANYTDAHGPGKSASSEATPTAVAPEAAPGTDGTVSLSPTSGLVSGDSVTASLTDPDNPTNQAWLWQRSANGSNNWSTISGATSASYTTTDADAGNFLRASVTYDDNSGNGQTAGPAATTGRVAIDSYDGNADGTIDGPEVLNAVRDYFARDIGPQRVLEVINLYFRGLNN